MKLGYCRITKTLTKFFYEKDGKSLEFYIDRDIPTSTAELWFKPGTVDARHEFTRDFADEAFRVELEQDNRDDARISEAILSEKKGEVVL